MLCLLHHLSRPPPRKRDSCPPCVLHLFCIVYHPAALEAGSESPFTLPRTVGECRFAKVKNREELL